MHRLVPLLLFVFFAMGCVSAPVVNQTANSSIFHDDYFVPNTAQFEPKSVFELSPVMQTYLRNSVLNRQSNANAKTLLNALYDVNRLQLEYESSYTRNAKEAFEAKKGNCISLVIMTAAFAKEMGLSVTFQSVFTPENISRDETSMYYSDHVNLIIGAVTTEVITGSLNNPRLVVDFLTPDNTLGQRTWVITEKTILAMYMNNRAAESLREKKLNQAYWWAKSAIESDPNFVAAYNTLGIIYERNGNLAEAELVHKHVIAIEPANLAALANLVRVYQKLGNAQEADATEQRLRAIKPTPPFYYFDLGMAAMKAKNYALARDYFQQEISTAAYNPEFNFWLAGAYIGLNDRAKAKKYLMIARDNAATSADKLRYEEQLKNLQRLIL
jgi:Tfp pilus assembly protein PilF